MCACCELVLTGITILTYTTAMNDTPFEKQDANKVVTVGVLAEYTADFLLPKIEELFEENNKRMDERFEENNKLIKVQFEEIISKNNGQQTYELKTYVDEKLNKQTEEIFTRLEKRFDRDKNFKEKLIAIMRAHRVGTLDEMMALEKLLTFQR